MYDHVKAGGHRHSNGCGNEYDRAHVRVYVHGDDPPHGCEYDKDPGLYILPDCRNRRFHT